MKSGWKLLVFLMIVFRANPLSAQGEFNYWYFGSGAALHFNSGTPVVINDGGINSGEGTASISDASGNLLFYTDGVRILNRQHQIMPNGNGLNGNLSTTQAALIVPKPGSTHLYYVFSLDDQQNQGNLYYSVVDMHLDQGRGDVVTGQKNLMLATGLTEKMTSANADACGTWIIVHSRNNSNYISFLLTADGIVQTVNSSAGLPHNNYVGTLKISEDFKKAVSVQITGVVELLDFNNATGQFSNAMQVPLPATAFPYSACFSPDGRFLYIPESQGMTGFDVYQYQLDLASFADVLASKTYAGSAATTSLPYTDLQLGPDGRIYMTRMGRTFLAVIPQPDLKAPFCGFQENGVNLLNRTSTLCLPNAVRVQKNLLQFSLGNDVSLCPGSSLVLQAPPYNVSRLWSDGSTGTSLTVSASGTYWLKVDNGICWYADTIDVRFDGRKVNLGPDTSICQGTNYNLDAGNFNSWLWEDNSVQPVRNISAPGTYWVQVTDECGTTSRDTIVVSWKGNNIPGIPHRTRCNNDTVILKSPGTYLSYSWWPDYSISSTSAPEVVVTPEVDTFYVLRAEIAPGCFAFDTVRVNRRISAPISLGADTAICAGSQYELDPGTGFNSYLWNSGSTLSRIRIENPGTYWIAARDNNGCTSRDTINIEWKACFTDIWVPNAFTPDGDGMNDFFRVLTKGAFVSFRLRVYNRWGQLVFASDQPKQGWDGRIKGTPTATGNYVWTLQYQLFGDGQKQAKGNVVLIR